MKHGTTNKRVPHESEDSEVNLPESKRVRVDSQDSELNLLEFNMAGNEPDESEVNSPELTQFLDESDDAVVNSIRDDFLDILDDSDPEIQGLDSVIKSFEEEILDLNPVMQSESGESLPDLGFLLKATDDELGLPPTHSTSGDNYDTNRTVDLERLTSDMIGFGYELPSYDSYEFGIGGESVNGNNDNGGEYVTLGGGLFDFEQADYWEFSYKTESLPAV